MLFTNNKNRQKIIEADDFSLYRLENREIFIDNLTVSLVNTIDSQIRV